ncbi:MAG: hypothetical protein IPK07_09225 [Deltaproteobacteria bacterium]|nr:hypothetical protein [Deltaproteobacteria bacterium]
MKRTALLARLGLALLLAGLQACVTEPQTRTLRSSTGEPGRVSIGFGFGGGSAAQKALAYQAHDELTAALARGEPLAAETILASFDRALRAALASERWLGVLGDLHIDWYDQSLDLFDGDRLHAEVSVSLEGGFVAVLRKVQRPGLRTVEASVWGGGGDEPAFATRELPVAGFGGTRLTVGEEFEHLQDLTLARLVFDAADGRRQTVFRCFPKREPRWTAYSFQTPQDVEAQDAAREALLARLDVSDAWVFADPDEDLARVYQQIAVVRADKTPAERVDRLIEIMRRAGEEEFLASLTTVVFPDGPVLRVRREELKQPMIRVAIGEDPFRLTYLFPGTLAVAYDSGPVARRWIDRAARDESFNFGTFLPDLWRGANEDLFIDVYRLERAKALAVGTQPSEKVLFDRTVRALAVIGAAWESETVRIGGAEFSIQITDRDIQALWAGIGKAGEGTQALPPGVSRVAPPSGVSSWKLERFSEGGLTFFHDGSLVYYEVQPGDVGDGGLDIIRRRLRTHIPGRYDHPIAFSGFRDDHLVAGLLVVVPDSPDLRVIGSARLRALVDAACAAEGFDYPELVFALVWNESRAGLDNFFRFEEGRLDAVTRLRDGLDGSDGQRFDDLYGRFGALLAGSYGPGHVLFETAWAMGFRGSPGELADPATNLRYVARYLRINGVDRSTSLERISRIYNGPGYARNDYHLRLRQNLARAERAYAEPVADQSDAGSGRARSERRSGAP